MKDTEAAKVAALFRKWREDPCEFVRVQFKAEPDIWQAEVLNALCLNQRVAMKACKGPGKSCVESWAIWWFLAMYPHAKILATSITGDNLRDNLWAELAFWQKKSRLLSTQFAWNVERITHKDHPETWFCSARTWSKQADKAQQANTLAGHHGEYTMIVIDEVGDIPAGVVSAADASLSTGKVNRIMMAGNPTRTEGPLYDACTTQRHLWWVKEITGDPNAPDRAPRISKEWAQQQIDLWGRDHPWVMVNVLGKFPPVQSDKLLGPDDVAAATQRSFREAEYLFEPLVLGVDVARFGDDRSVAIARQGRMARRPTVFRNMDLMELAQQVARLYWDMTPQPQIIFVDETGIGSGVVDRLRQLGLPVLGINFSSKPRDPRFADKRSEMWWDMASWVRGRNGPETGANIPNDPDLMFELAAPSYYFTNTSKLKLESKDEMKKRGVASPDVADALALTFAEQVVAPQNFAGGAARPRGVLHEYDPFDGRL